MHQEPVPQLDDVVLDRCQNAPPLPVVTTVAPVGSQQFLYVAGADHLYAVNANDGRVRWCQQVKLNREYRYHPGVSYPPPSRMTFGTPRVLNDVLYVCASGNEGYTYAFNAGDGTSRWRARTDAWIVAMPFMDYAVPIVKNGIVYNGTYALLEQDGTVLWRIAIDVRTEGALSLHALVEGTLYANTQMGVYAINAENGEIRWLYEPDRHTIISGPLIVANHLLYIGTSGSVDHPEKSCFYALDVETGSLRWQYPMGRYVGAVIHNDSISVSSGDHYLYTLDKNNGDLRWKYRFVRPGHYPATFAKNTLYLNNDGAYALSSSDGKLLWHQTLGSNPGTYFIPPIVLDEVVYLASIDGRGRSILYSLAANNGAEYWHCHYPYQLAPLAVAR